MRVVQIISSLRGGGAQKVAIELHNNFMKMGNDSTLISLAKVNDYENLENILYINPNNLINFLKNSSYDLILVHMRHGVELLQEIKSNKNIFFVIHTAIYERIKTFNLLKFYKNKKELKRLYDNSNIITVSNGIKNDIDKLKINYNFLQTIYNPFNISKIKTLAREKIDLDFEYIINIGTFNKIKNQELLIKTLPLLPNNLHLVILGKGRLENYLKKLAKKLGVEKRVHFLGWKQNPYPYIKNAKLMVHTSKFEGFGNVLVESLILNTPVVSTNYKWGVDEILKDELKFFISDFNKKELKYKIIKALKNYPNITERFYKQFDSDLIAKKYLSLLKG